MYWLALCKSYISLRAYHSSQNKLQINPRTLRFCVKSVDILLCTTCQFCVKSADILLCTICQLCVKSVDILLCTTCQFCVKSADTLPCTTCHQIYIVLSNSKHWLKSLRGAGKPDLECRVVALSNRLQLIGSSCILPFTSGK